MKITKLINYFIFILILNLSFFTIKSENPFPMPTQEEIDEILNSPEFKEFAKEFEEALGDIDEDDFAPISKKEKKRIEEKLKEESDPEIFIDRKKNFLSPIDKKDKEDSGKKKINRKLHPKKTEDFYYYANSLTKNINEIVSKINSFFWGIAFKEDCENKKIQSTAHNLESIIEEIKSKKLFQRLLYSKNNNKLREMFLNTAEKTKKLNSKIKRSSSKEKKELLEIEKLKKLAQSKEKIDKKLKKKKLTLTPLQREMQAFFVKDFSELEKELTKLLKHTQVKTEIDKKIKKRKKQEKEADRRLKKSKPYPTPDYYRRDRRDNRWTGNNWRDRGRGWNRPSYGRDYRKYPSTPRKSQTKPKPSLTDKTPSKKTTKPDSDAIKKKREEDAKKKKEFEKIKEEILKDVDIAESLITENIKLFNDISKIYKENDKKTWTKIFDESLLSKIEKNFMELDQIEEKLFKDKKLDISIKAKQDTMLTKEAKVEKTNEREELKKIKEEKEKLTKSLKTKRQVFKNRVKKFVPTGIRLAKYPSEKEEYITEKKSAFNIIKRESESIQEEIKKYETEILKLIQGKEQIIGRYNTTAEDLNKILVNLETLISKPNADSEEIETVKDNIKVEVVIALAEQEKIVRLMEQIKDNLINNNAININQMVQNIQSNHSANLRRDLDTLVTNAVGNRQVQQQAQVLQIILSNGTAKALDENQKKSLIKRILIGKKQENRKLNILKKINDLV